MAIIKKVTYQCGFCWEEFDEKFTMFEIEEHHNNCACNPNNKACPTCKHSKGYQTAHYGCLIGYSDEFEINCKCWKDKNESKELSF